MSFIMSDLHPSKIELITFENKQAGMILKKCKKHEILIDSLGNYENFLLEYVVIHNIMLIDIIIQ